MTRFEVKTLTVRGTEVFQIWDNEKNEAFTRKVKGRGLIAYIYHPIEARLTCAKMNTADKAEKAGKSVAFDASFRG